VHVLRAIVALLVLVLALAACGSGEGEGPAASPSTRSVTLTADQAAVITFTGGRYRFTWDAGSCSDFAIRLEPTAGGEPLVVPVSGGQGSSEIDVPAFEARVERSGTCSSAGHTVTIEKL
jgi:hypothetical protein